MGIDVSRSTLYCLSEPMRHPPSAEFAKLLKNTIDAGGDTK